MAIDWRNRLALNVELDGDWRVQVYEANLALVRRFDRSTFHKPFILYKSFAVYATDGTRDKGLDMFRLALTNAQKDKESARGFLIRTPRIVPGVAEDHRTKATVLPASNLEDALHLLNDYIDRVLAALGKPGAKTVNNKRYDVIGFGIREDEGKKANNETALLNILERCHKARVIPFIFAEHPEHLPESVRALISWQLHIGGKLSEWAKTFYNKEVLDNSTSFIPVGIAYDRVRDPDYLWKSYPHISRVLEERKIIGRIHNKEAKDYREFLAGLVDEE